MLIRWHAWYTAERVCLLGGRRGHTVALVRLGGKVNKVAGVDTLLARCWRVDTLLRGRA